MIGLHAPPLVVKDTVVVGAAPTLDSKGYVRGFDVKTGQRKWIFHTIPRKGEFGYDTWTTPGQAEAAGNTGAWAPMSADPKNWAWSMSRWNCPQTDMLGVTRTGDNLFGETLVALDIETGQRKWHYQIIHHGLQDRDISCAGDPVRHPAQRKDREGDRPAHQAGLALCAGSHQRQTGVSRFRKSRSPRARCRANSIRRPSPCPARRRLSPDRA